MPSLIHFAIAFKNFFNPIDFTKSFTKSQECTKFLFVVAMLPETSPLTAGVDG
jgi:hypothetical protein